jgi:pimeloyl-ACP methyl ester carboxylesterase
MLKTLLKLSLVLIVIAALGLSIFWFSAPADVSFEEVRSSVPHSESSHFAEIDGVRLHYQEKGEGTPLVLIHGFTSSAYSWKDVFEPFSRSFHVIAVDLKGFGFSGKPDGDYTKRAQAQLVVQLLDHLKIEKAWLAGCSMGGEVAINVALANPQRVAGLVLIDSAGVTVTGGSSLAPAYVRLPVVGRLLTALALRSDTLVREGLEKSFYDDAKVTSERVANYYRPLSTRAGQLAALRASTQWDQFPVEQDLGRITARTLIIWGEEDALIPLAAGQTMNSLIKDSKLVIIEKCGHLPQEEIPERVLDEVSAFMNVNTVISQMETHEKLSVP